MADVSTTVNNVIGGIVGILKGLIVLFVFAIILYPGITVDVVDGLIGLVDSFLENGFPGLLALLILVSFLD